MMNINESTIYLVDLLYYYITKLYLSIKINNINNIYLTYLLEHVIYIYIIT